MSNRDLFTTADDAVELAVHVQPGAGRTQVVGRHGAALKVRVAAPPEQGKANDAVAALLAEEFGLEPGAVKLASGGTSRSKRFTLAGVDPDAFADRLDEVVTGTPAPGKRGGRPR